MSIGTAAPPLATIAELLKAFAKQPGCEAYTADSKKIELLEHYLWIRQLTPGLTFETFLGLFAQVADYNEENLKYPADAIKRLAPRDSRAAKKFNLHQWSALSLVDFLGLYVDMIREAELAAQPIPLPLNNFLVDMRELYLSGALNPPAAAAPSPTVAVAAGKTKKKRAAPPSAASGPTTAGQRVMYTDPAGRQYRGLSTDVNTEKGYITFTADSGEVLDGVALANCVVIQDDAEPELDPALVVEAVKLWLSPAAHAKMRQALDMNMAMGNMDLGVIIIPTHVQFAATPEFPKGLVADLHILNGQQGPYVDPILAEPDAPAGVSDLPPRKSIVGRYDFDVGGKYFVVDVRVRGGDAA